MLWSGGGVDGDATKHFYVCYKSSKEIAENFIALKQIEKRTELSIRRMRHTHTHTNTVNRPLTSILAYGFELSLALVAVKRIGAFRHHLYNVIIMYIVHVEV